MTIQSDALEDLFRSIPDASLSCLFREKENLKVKFSFNAMIKKLPGLESTDTGTEIYIYGKSIHERIRKTAEGGDKLKMISDMVKNIEENYDLYQNIKKR